MIKSNETKREKFERERDELAAQVGETIATEARADEAKAKAPRKPRKAKKA